MAKPVKFDASFNFGANRKPKSGGKKAGGKQGKGGRGSFGS